MKILSPVLIMLFIFFDFINPACFAQCFDCIENINSSKSQLLFETDNFKDMAIFSENEVVAIGGTQEIIKSSNGKDWYIANIDYDLNNVFSHVEAVDENIALAVNSGRIFKSTDKGDNWVALSYDIDDDGNYYLSSGQDRITGVSGIKCNSGYCYLGATGGLFTSTDSGNTWILMPALGEALTALSVVSRNLAFVLTSDGDTYKTINGGASWSKVGINIRTDINHFVYTDEMNGWASYVFGIFKTSDGGNNWCPVYQEDYARDIAVIGPNECMFSRGGFELYSLKVDGCNDVELCQITNGPHDEGYINYHSIQKIDFIKNAQNIHLIASGFEEGGRTERGVLSFDYKPDCEDDNDGNCGNGVNIGDPCDDNDPNTSNDQINNNCECAGAIDYDCPDLQKNIGESCDDQDPQTQNDYVRNDCTCMGTIEYDCPDLQKDKGDECDDGNNQSGPDFVNDQCVCEATYQCQNLSGDIGDPCDDQNPNTSDDKIVTGCLCEGTPGGNMPMLEIPITIWKENNAWSNSQINQHISITNEKLEQARIRIYNWESEFRKLNKDFYNDPSRFEGLVVSSEIVSSTGAFVPNTLNIYFVDNINVSGDSHGIAGTADGFPSTLDGNDAIFIDPDVGLLNSGLLAHEIGHYLGLRHTWGNTGLEYGENSKTTEKVQRDNSTCDLHDVGDKICDTPADPGNYYIWTQDCIYTCNRGNSNDACHFESQNTAGARYEPDTRNIMSYFLYCQDSFTNKQVEIMRSSVNQRNFSTNPVSCAVDAYEPNYLRIARPDKPLLYHASEYFLNNSQEGENKIVGRFDNEFDFDVYEFESKEGENLIVNFDPRGRESFLLISNTDSPKDLIYNEMSNGNALEFPMTRLDGQSNYILTVKASSSTSDCNNFYTLSFENSSCFDTHEPNSTIGTEKTIGSFDKAGESYNIESNLSVEGDRDIFRIDATDPGKYSFALVDLDIDADMTILANAPGSSRRFTNFQNGTQSESIEVNITAQDNIEYFLISVVGKNGAFSCDGDYIISARWKEGESDDGEPDNNEPNNSFSQAEDFGDLVASSKNSITGNIHTTGDIDYFSFYLGQPGRLQVDLSRLPADYDLILYDDSRNEVKESRSTGLKSESISYQFQGASRTRFYVAIVPYDNASSPDNYQLDINWYPDEEEQPCEDNLYEPNNIAQAAKYPFSVLRQSSSEQLLTAKIATFEDVDFYKIDLRAEGELVLGFTDTNANLKMELFNNGSLVGETTPSSSSPILFTNSLEYDIILMKISGLDNDLDCESLYNVQLNWLPDLEGGCPEDSYSEPNNSIGQAVNGLFNFAGINETKSTKGLVSYNGDKDYYVLSTTGSGFLDIQLKNLPENFDMKVVDDRDRTQHSSNKSNRTNEIIRFRTKEAVTYYLQVYSKSQEFHCLKTYDLSITWYPDVQDEPEPECEDINNNSLETAAYVFPFLGFQTGTFTDTYRDGRISNAYQSDYYEIAGDGSGWFSVQLSDFESDLDLYILDYDGNVIAKSENAGSKNETLSISFNGAHFIQVVSSRSYFDCSDSYTLTLHWNPQENSEHEFNCQGEVIPFSSWMQAQEFGDPDLYYDGNTSNGTDLIENYDCDSRRTGKEQILEFFYSDQLSGYLDFYLESSVAGLNFYILDSCDPSSFCFGKGELGDKESYLPIWNTLEMGRSYYIFIDGIANNVEYRISASGFYTVFDDENGCNTEPPSISYTCNENNYNVGLNYSQVNVLSIDAGNYLVATTFDGFFEVQNVHNEDFDIEVNYRRDDGQICEFIHSVPAYNCNVSVANCFGIDQPSIPENIYACTKNELTFTDIDLPTEYSIEWFSSATSFQVISRNSRYIPNDFGTYYFQFVGEGESCRSDRIPATFIQEEPIEFNFLKIDNSCHGLSDGRIELFLNKSEEFYDILWSTGETDASIDNLKAGPYEVTLSNGSCSESKEFRIGEPDPIQEKNPRFYIQIVSDTGSPLGEYHLCEGESAEIDLEFEGGVEPYQYQWSTGVNAPSIEVSDPGVYAISVSDANGCNFERDVFVTKSYLADFTLDQTYVYDHYSLFSTNGFANGVWSNGIKENTIDADAPGWYTYTVSDGVCAQSDSIWADEAAPLSMTLKAENNTCGQTNGSISISAAGDAGPFVYSIDGRSFSNNSLFENLASGTYEVLVMDSESNIIRENIEIESNYVQPVFDTEVIHPTCGLDNGVVELITQSNLSILIDGMLQDSFIIGDLAPSVYEVSVVDQDGCSVTGIVELNTSSEVLVSINSSSTDSLIANASNGLPPYKYFWNGIEGDSVYVPSSSGEIELVVVDAAGCEAEELFNFSTSTTEFEKFGIVVYPNPLRNQLIVDLGGNRFEGFYEISSILGEKVKIVPIESEHTIIDMSDLSQGVYLISIQGMNGGKKVVKIE